MTPEDLLQLARERRGGQIVLVLPHHSRGEKIRLCKTRGPRGHICCEKPDGTVASFAADEVAAFLEKQGVGTPAPSTPE